jgi:hypothetical protein
MNHFQTTEKLPHPRARLQDETHDQKATRGRATARTRDKGPGASSRQRLDHLAGELKRHGLLRENFLRSPEGRSCLRLLHRLDDSTVSRELKRRGLGGDQVQKLRKELFVHLRRQVARTICDGIKGIRQTVAGLNRDAGARKGFARYLAGLKSEKARAQVLQRLGVEGKAAARIARTPRGAESRLAAALKTADSNLKRLWTQATMSKIDSIRAIDTFDLFSPVVDKVRKEMGLPAGSGSFGSRALDAGIKNARRSRKKLNTYGTISGIAASIVATIVTGGSYGVAAAAVLGATSSATTSVVTGLPGVAKARHKRKLAETGEALGLTKGGAARKARRRERSTKKQLIAGGVVSGALGAGGAALGAAKAGGLVDDALRAGVKAGRTGCGGEVAAAKASKLAADAAAAKAGPAATAKALGYATAADLVNRYGTPRVVR